MVSDPSPATRGECPTCGTLCVMHPLSAGRSYTPVSEMGTPDVEQAVKWLESSAKHDDEQTLFGNADQARKIIKILRAFPSAIEPKCCPRCGFLS